MRRMLMALTLLLGTAAGSPQSARADCVGDAVKSCDGDFGGGSNYYLIAIRGWCYIIRTGMCEALDS